MTLFLTESRLAAWPHLVGVVTRAYRNVHGVQVYRVELAIAAPGSGQ